jgi:hypothetical protein
MEGRRIMLKSYDPGEALAIVNRLHKFLDDNDGLYTIYSVAKSTCVDESTLFQWLNMGRKPQARMLAKLQAIEKYLDKKEW